MTGSAKAVDTLFLPLIRKEADTSWQRLYQCFLKNFFQKPCKIENASDGISWGEESHPPGSRSGGRTILLQCTNPKGRRVREAKAEADLD